MQGWKMQLMDLNAGVCGEKFVLRTCTDWRTSHCGPHAAFVPQLCVELAHLQFTNLSEMIECTAALIDHLSWQKRHSYPNLQFAPLGGKGWTRLLQTSTTTVSLANQEPKDMHFLRILMLVDLQFDADFSGSTWIGIPLFASVSVCGRESTLSFRILSCAAYQRFVSVQDLKSRVAEMIPEEQVTFCHPSS